jgi:lactate/malate dehydrogenase family protein
MRVVIAGAGGGVGASLAFNLLLSPLECEVVMADARQNMLLSHLWDLEQVLEQVPGGSVRAGSEDDIAGADALVITAAAPLTVNSSRMVRGCAEAWMAASKHGPRYLRWGRPEGAGEPSGNADDEVGNYCQACHQGHHVDGESRLRARICHPRRRGRSSPTLGPPFPSQSLTFARAPLQRRPMPTA